MSEAHDEHESAIKTPKQLIAAVIAAFLIPIIGIIMLANYVNTTDKKVGAGSSMSSEDAASARIRPVARLELKDASGPRELKTGEQVFKEACASCHATGAAGAPKVGSGDWAPRLGQGLDGLLKNAIAGKNAMPKRGGTSADDYSDFELARAIVYMANASGGKLAEPAAPASASGATAAAPAAGATAAAPAAMPAATAVTTTAAATTAAPAKAATADAGKAVYDQACAACHGTGAAGAPKFGDKAAWGPRIAQGKPALYASALKGKNAMPPKGGSTASDADLKAAVDYMTAAAK